MGPFWPLLDPILGCFERSEISGDPKPQTPDRDIAWRHPSERCYRQGIRDPTSNGHLGIALKVYIRVYGIMACTLYGTSPPSAAPFRPHI